MKNMNDNNETRDCSLNILNNEVVYNINKNNK